MIFDNPTRDIFASSLGVIAGLVITIGAYLKAALGKFSKAAPPVEDYSGSTRAMLNVLLVAPLVITLMLVTPANALYFLFGIAMAGLGALLCRQQYNKAKAGHLFKKPVPRKFQRLRKALGISTFTEEWLIGGDTLIPGAVADKARLGYTDQELLAAYGYDPAKMWDDADRATAFVRIERWYYSYVFLAVMTLVVTSIASQALLSERSPKDEAIAIWAKAHPRHR